MHFDDYNAIWLHELIVLLHCITPCNTLWFLYLIRLFLQCFVSLGVLHRNHTLERFFLGNLNLLGRRKNGRGDGVRPCSCKEGLGTRLGVGCVIWPVWVVQQGSVHSATVPPRGAYEPPLSPAACQFCHLCGREVERDQEREEWRELWSKAGSGWQWWLLNIFLNIHHKQCTCFTMHTSQLGVSVQKLLMYTVHMHC